MSNGKVRRDVVLVSNSKGKKRYAEISNRQGLNRPELQQQKLKMKGIKK